MIDNYSGITIKAILYHKPSNAFLLARREKEIGLEPFGGHHEYGETLCETLLRELNEEANINPNKIDGITYVTTQKLVNHYFIIEVNTNELKLSSEHHGYEVISADDIKQEQFRFDDLFNTYVEAYEIIKKNKANKTLHLCEVVPKEIELYKQCFLNKSDKINN